MQLTSQQATLLFEIALTLSVILWMQRSLPGKKESWHYIITVFNYGVLAAMICAVIQIRYIIPLPEYSDPLLELGQGFWVVVIEELSKYIAALIAITNARHLYRMSSAITYLIIVGLSFAITEDIFYFFAASSPSLPRLLSFFVHAGTSSIVGYTLGQYRFGRAGYRNLAGAFLAAVLMHWSFNVGVSLTDPTQASLITAAIIIFVSSRVFVLYRRTVQEEYQMERALLQSLEAPEPTKLLNA